MTAPTIARALLRELICLHARRSAPLVAPNIIAAMQDRLYSQDYDGVHMRRCLRLALQNETCVPQPDAARQAVVALSTLDSLERALSADAKQRALAALASLEQASKAGK